MSDHDIDASNVLPAFQASLRFGATEPELARELGWEREALESDGATVSGASTYRHMEMMYGRTGFADFVMAATELHTLSSLGAVGLACKTVPTVGDAMACHHRYQHLTNRTASYSAQLDGDELTLREDRFGEVSWGSRLISDYTMFIALRLLRLSGGEPVVRRMRSRRDAMSDIERTRYEAFLGAPIELGAEAAELVMVASIVATPIASADAELASYLKGVLERTAPPEDDDPPLLREVRDAIRESLPHGGATTGQVAKRLGMGPRTLQRRLADLDLSFAEALDSTRQGLAARYLAGPELSVSEIAYLLGYNERASFYRAFRRWHDTTPAAYRRELRAS
ncbi:MAG: helix-turn-helix domain-containing protein [Sandaracinaceae bacterium]